jgi:molybdopterin converting factor small subunit
MVNVSFTPNLEKHLEVPQLTVAGSTIGEVLDACCDANPALRGYILDDQGRVRKHVAVFIDGAIISDKVTLTDAVNGDSKVFVMQALSGG